MSTPLEQALAIAEMEPHKIEHLLGGRVRMKSLMLRTRLPDEHDAAALLKVFQPLIGIQRGFFAADRWQRCIDREKGGTWLHISGELGKQIAAEAHLHDCRAGGCGLNADYLCDFPTGKGETCDLPLCYGHAEPIDDDMHLCPIHLAMMNDGDTPRDTPAP